VNLNMIHGGPFDPVPIDPDEIRGVACRLVESKTVCSPPEPPQPQQTSTSGGGSFLELLLQLILIAAVAALVIVIVRLIMGLPPLSRRPKMVDGDDDEVVDDDQLVGTVIIDRSREPIDWRAEADQHRGAGRYRDALRCRYRALVGDLARRGLLDEIPGRTTGEERRQMSRSSPAVVPGFTAAADLFDDAWFGHVVVGQADDDRFQNYERDVLAGAVAMPQRVPRQYQPDQSQPELV
jgi:hypothetical protein